MMMRMMMMILLMTRMPWGSIESAAAGGAHKTGMPWWSHDDEMESKPMNHRHHQYHPSDGPKAVAAHLIHKCRRPAMTNDTTLWVLFETRF
jgi:hypothetical protein